MSESMRAAILVTIERLGTEVARLASVLAAAEPQHGIDLQVDAIHGRRNAVNIDRGSMELVDTEKVLLSIAGKDASGVVRAIPADEYSWQSDDPGVVALEEAVNEDGTPGDQYTRWARTPATGRVLVTVTHVPSGNTETLSLSVNRSGPGEIGLSAGTPVPEAPPVPQ